MPGRAISFFIGLVCAAILAPPALLILAKTRFNKVNYRGKKIVGSTGVILPLSMAAYSVVILLFFGRLIINDLSRFWPPLAIMISLSILGLIDDFAGDRSAGGFKGHFGRLLKGEITTGAIKALGGGFVSIMAVYPYSNGLIDLFVRGITLALFINLFNLLDLRPGRALKVFIILALGLFVRLEGTASQSFLAATLAVAVILLFIDLFEVGMLGDAGSNAIGGIGGYYLVIGLNLWANLVLMVVLLAINLYSETRSISGLIEQAAPLRWFDRLGRRR